MSPQAATTDPKRNTITLPSRAIALIQLAGHLKHRTDNIACAALDITRLRQDTGFEPQSATVRAAAGYIAWLRAGND